MPPTNPRRDTPQRLSLLMSRLRAKQLELARHGKTTDSARYAQRAQRVRLAMSLAA